MGDLQNGEFHVTDGFTAKRVDSGQVRLRKYTDSYLDRILFEITFSASVWASIVSSVCARGETSESYHEQKKFHDQKPDKEAK